MSGRFDRDATAGYQSFLDDRRGSTTGRVLLHARCPVLSEPGN
jgi:nucleotide-binding universal stress UspA family protein